jgi:drug/metabolite transporter (DMT)-like permease
MFAFFKGLSLTSPMSASVMMVTSPIIVLLFSRILVRSAIGKRRILGVFIGLLGAILLITFGNSSNVNN